MLCCWMVRGVPAGLAAGAARLAVPAAASIACALWLAASPLVAAESGRVSSDLVARYDFAESSGEIVHDTSGVGQPLDLRIDDARRVGWKNGGLAIPSGVRIRSPQPATKVIDAIQKSNALTVEAWLTPLDNRQSGPARVVSLSADTSNRNFTLGQDGNRWDLRLRAKSTSANGLPSTAAPADSVRTQRTHLLFTRDERGSARFWLDGKQVAAGKVEGNFANWDGEQHLALANEQTSDRPWLGELHLVAIYARALTDAEVARNYAAGIPGKIDYATLLPPPIGRQIDFVKDVQPVFRAHCFECHAQGNEEGGLNLGIRARAMAGGESGSVISVGDSASSRLVHLVAGVVKDQRMPPPGEGEPLSDAQVGILRAWIDQGAKWPDDADVLDPRTERARSHWAFRPLAPIRPPAVKNTAWVQTPIDQFLLAELEAKGIEPTSPAAGRKLIRRMVFDVTGLPPAPEEVEAFAQANDVPAAAAALADKLLDSRHYGERWGRHWLDVARYADSDGQEADRDRPGAYHFRDFVIRAFNEDLPFDDFVRRQIAGDELAPDNPAAVAATGFWVAGPHTVLENTFLEEERLRNRYNELDDMVSTLGSAMLGVTIGCARCHDHKYDAIASRDYYQLLAAVHSGDRAEVTLPGGKDKALAFRDFGSQPATTWLFQRADFYDRDQTVQLGFPAALSRGKSADSYWQEARPEKGGESTYQRAALANWLTDVEQGAGALVARVIVNRVWQHHFGYGLSRTESDFGVRGEQPSHPELLDWLAADFVAHGWKLKRLHRMILTSSAYQQGGAFDAAKAKTDSENRLLWRMTPRRQEAEALRDAILEVSGTLNLEAYGPAFKAPIAAEAMVARNLQGEPYPKNIPDTPAVRRRTVYIFHKRVIPDPLLAAFDRPDSLQSCSRRLETTVAPQALALLNDDFVRRRALDFADRLLRECGDDDDQLVRRSFALAFARPPDDTELAESIEFFHTQAAGRRERDGKLSAAKVRRLAIADYCQVLFGLNEFIYID